VCPDNHGFIRDNQRVILIILIIKKFPNSAVYEGFQLMGRLAWELPKPIGIDMSTFSVSVVGLRTGIHIRGRMKDETKIFSITGFGWVDAVLAGR
jgi:hypothetical protein